ncbi:hypothetical protein [uncultured Campylobacter sp.]|uniref:hypothetical protein n=1 Tax=uncultured Campylobacter sp. TaxID=218934 RepID=UPI0026234B06|nr:hypothetical protein [uncultured Campylobacter sp.]
MRLNLIVRFAVHARSFVVYCMAAASAEQKLRCRIKILKFNAARRNLSFAFYTVRPKSGFYVAKF